MQVTSIVSLLEENKRVWRNFSTAVGEALLASEIALTEVPHCARKVIDENGFSVRASLRLSIDGRAGEC